MTSAKKTRHLGLAVALFFVGLVCALILYRLWSFARASAGTAYPIDVGAGEYALLGGGALVCWAGVIVLVVRGRRGSR